MSRVAAYAVQRTTADWLESLHPWNWWVTLTFQWFSRREEAMQHTREWMRGLARGDFGAVSPPSCFVTVSTVEQDQRGAWHVHAVLAIPERVRFDPATAVRLWRSYDRINGRALIRRYQRVGEGAVFYILKTDEWQPPEIICSRSNDCRRRGRCRLERPE